MSPSPPPFAAPDDPTARLTRRLDRVESWARGLVRRARGGRGAWRDVTFPTPTRTARRRDPAPRPLVLLLGALPWRYRPQRPQELALALSELEVDVLYVEVFGRNRFQPAVDLAEIAPGLHRLRLRLPGQPDPYRTLPPDTVDDTTMDRLCSGLQRDPEAVICQLPFHLPLATALADRFGCPLCYDRLDHHAGFPDAPPGIEAAERSLIDAADLVTCSSTTLARGIQPPPLIVPNGFQAEEFADVGTRRPAGLAGPRRAGLVGALDHRIDVPALRGLLDAVPDLTLVLGGAVENPVIAELGRSRRVELLGELDRRDVPPTLAGLDLGLIPYVDSEFTRAIDPVKLYEMLAVGLPVAAFRLPALESWEPPLVHPYDAPDDLASAAAKALSEDSEELRRRRRAAVAGHTWRERAQRILFGLLPHRKTSAPQTATENPPRDASPSP